MHGRCDNVFERNKKKVCLVVVLVLVSACVLLTETCLRKVMGLGNPVLYDSSPLYGFRPLPNSEYHRFRGARLRFNNLGLRAESDFDGDPNNKVLFLGDSVTYGGSYIGNKELFSCLAVEDLGNYESGNAAVNAWGVENIYGLIVECGFLPAKVYITTLPEGDFYRGLTRCQGMPFFNVRPRLALLELWYYFCFRQNTRRYREWQTYAGKDDKRLVVEKAVRRLKEMDEFLKGKGLDHLIFITPRKEQVVGDAGKDPLVKELLAKHGLHPVYIGDKLSECGLSAPEKQKLFYDSIHLEKEGHAVWAKIIRHELDKIIPNSTVETACVDRPTQRQPSTHRSLRSVRQSGRRHGEMKSTRSDPISACDRLGSVIAPPTTPWAQAI